MTLIRTICRNCIALHTGKQKVRSAKVGILAPEFEKPDTDPKPKLNVYLDVKEFSIWWHLTLGL